MNNNNNKCHKAAREQEAKVHFESRPNSIE